jgi:carbon-monoxide dehydrogenase medium subunit
MHDFMYRRATSVADALAAKRQDADARYLAGGMSLIPILKQRLASPGLLIDLRHLEALRLIRLAGDRLIIGALATHDAIARSPVVRTAIPALAFMAGEIGDPQVRNAGTLGGAVANNDPAADYPAAVLGLGAAVVTDRRELAADDFFGGLFQTALEPDELITEIAFPIPERAGYARFCQLASRYPLVGVLAAKTVMGVRVGVIGAGACVFRIPEFEDALAGDFAADALGGLAMPEYGLNNDLHGSAGYRAHLIGVLARRAVRDAL